MTAQPPARGRPVPCCSIPGRVPELVLYDASNVEIERMFVDKLHYDELHTLIQTKGFSRKGGLRSGGAAMAP
ncbi:hypothetical protein TSOC_013200 [Tetrabaena socialis]|uniref:Selenoprotein F/M domain-containing protein n=1 Tax=Tetrabaena socialis TaxID=47790 RepID=A0A2J7ZKY6_9CHLO|nr:hypothetical protein TSOC_013200 [Tetrabaena socialis]|eukprot:PNH00939.1 hypothetical protein TSOC_013200 [Tetrabaena socialis]